MKRILSIAILSTLMFFAPALHADGPTKSPQQAYVEHFATLAVEEMYRSGVPASITLAQGLLESRYGLSDLAVKGNNHFGIKCHNNWDGGKMYHDDDRKGECFRVYKSPEESFRDHSDFLRYRDRYKFLFDLEPTDYKGWAHGLKKAGYATDPAYPQKLIKLNEDYGLHEYDTKPASWGYENEDTVKPQTKQDKKKLTKEEKKAEKARKKAEKSKTHPEKRPESPNSIEQAKPLTADQREVFHLALSRQMYSLNGVPFVYAAEGETYASIAAAYNLFMKEILKFNASNLGAVELTMALHLFLDFPDDKLIWDVGNFSTMVTVQRNAAWTVLRVAYTARIYVSPTLVSVWTTHLPTAKIM